MRAGAGASVAIVVAPPAPRARPSRGHDRVRDVWSTTTARGRDGPAAGPCARERPSGSFKGELHARLVRRSHWSAYRAGRRPRHLLLRFYERSAGASSSTASTRASSTDQLARWSLRQQTSSSSRATSRLHSLSAPLSRMRRRAARGSARIGHRRLPTDTPTPRRARASVSVGARQLLSFARAIAAIRGSGARRGASAVDRGSRRRPRALAELMSGRTTNRRRPPLALSSAPTRFWCCTGQVRERGTTSSCRTPALYERLYRLQAGSADPARCLERQRMTLAAQMVGVFDRESHRRRATAESRGAPRPADRLARDRRASAPMPHQVNNQQYSLGRTTLSGRAMLRTYRFRARAPASRPSSRSGRPEWLDPARSRRPSCASMRRPGAEPTHSCTATGRGGGHDMLFAEEQRAA